MTLIEGLKNAKLLLFIPFRAAGKIELRASKTLSGF